MRGISQEEEGLVEQYRSLSASKSWVTTGAVASFIVGFFVLPLILVAIGLAVGSAVLGRRRDSTYYKIVRLRQLPEPPDLAPGRFVTLVPHVEGLSTGALVGSIVDVEENGTNGEAEILSEPLGSERSLWAYGGSHPIRRGAIVDWERRGTSFNIVGVSTSAASLPGFTEEQASSVRRLEQVVEAQKRLAQSLGELQQADDELRELGAKQKNREDRDVR